MVRAVENGLSRVRRGGIYEFNWVVGLDESRVIRCN